MIFAMVAAPDRLFLGGDARRRRPRLTRRRERHGALGAWPVRASRGRMVDGERGRSGRPDRRSAVLAEFPAPDAAGPASGPDAAGPDGTGPDGGTATAPARRPRTRLLLLLAAAVLAVDAGSKIAVVATMDQGQSIRLLGGLVYLSFYRNTGAAFSFAQGATILFSLLAVAVAVVIVRTSRRLFSTGWAVALGLVLGGAAGNLADRVFRSPGFLKGGVVDFISVFGADGKVWPIFNAADSAIVCGGILGALLAVRGIEFDGTRSRADAGSGSAGSRRAGSGSAGSGDTGERDS